jgi:hypothetical protein
MAADHQPGLPSPGLIWWRAQILRKQQEKERIERPMIIMRWVVAVVCAAAALVLLAGNWSLFYTAAETHRSLLPLGILALAISAVSMAILLWLPASKA